MPASFPELRGAPQFWKSLLFQTEDLTQPMADLMVSRWLHQRRWPLILKSALQFLKSDTALKINPIWGVKINFGPQFRQYIYCLLSRQYIQHAFLQKVWPKLGKYDRGSCSMKTLPRIGGHHHVPSLSSFQQRDGFSNVLTQNRLA